MTMSTINPDSLAQYFLLAAIIIDAILGWFVLLRNPKNATHQSYFVLVCSITVWQVATYLTIFIFNTDELRVVGFRAIYVAMIAVVLNLLYFINLFGREEHSAKIFGALLAIIVLVVAICIPSDFLFSSSSERIVFTGPAYGWIVFFLLGLIGILFASALYRLLTAEDQRTYVQLEYLVLGLFIPMLFGAFSTIILPFVRNEHSFIEFSSIGVFGAATTCCFSFLMGYAMARHRLMDMRMSLKRKTLAAIITFISVLAATAFVVLSLRDHLVLDAPRIIAAFFIFGISVLCIYEVVLQLLYMFMKRGVLSLTAYTHDEELFLRNIESPRRWSRRWAGKLQKQFGVETLQCITYDHLAQCWKQTFPESKIKYRIEEDWIVALQKAKQKVYSKGGGLIEGKIGSLDGEMLIAMYDPFRCMGVWVFGKKLDGTQWNDDDVIELEKLVVVAEKELWYVMQQEYMMIMAMEDGVELPKELLIEEDEYEA